MALGGLSFSLLKVVRDMEETPLRNLELDPTLIPQHLPLHVGLSRDLERATMWPECPEELASSTVKDHMAILKQYLDYVIQHPHLLSTEREAIMDTLNGYADTLAHMIAAKHTASLEKASLKDVKSHVRDASAQYPELSLDTYATYPQHQDLAFDETWVTERDLSAKVKADPDYVYVHNVARVLIDPEDPLPEDEADDDVAVSGGKISLKDPISQNFFEEPLASRKCKHVYEKRYILRELLHKKVCPVDGCDASLEKGDLVPDDLMSLRVKVYKAMSARRARDVERL